MTDCVSVFLSWPPCWANAELSHLPPAARSTREHVNVVRKLRVGTQWGVVFTSSAMDW